MNYREINFEDKRNSNENYRETVRGKCWDLKDCGISYTAMAKACGVGITTVRNFANCYRDGMREDNWKKFSSYIDETWNKFFEKGN